MPGIKPGEVDGKEGDDEGGRGEGGKQHGTDWVG